ncbi:MAG: hypothetical protein EA369_09895 [Bradymonadales bacterium]|nr:MAG: hypothetical protein EA369_09895 [Bradymonadales bacterium]
MAEVERMGPVSLEDLRAELKESFLPEAFHPEILDQVLWSLSWLSWAARNPTQGFSKENFRSHALRVLRQLEAASEDFSDSEMGALGELRVAAHLVARGYSLQGIRESYRMKIRGKSEVGEFDLLIRDPEDSKLLWAVEVKARLGDRHLSNRSRESLRKLRRAQKASEAGQLVLEAGKGQARISRLLVFSLEEPSQKIQERHGKLFPDIDLKTYPPGLMRSSAFPSRRMGPSASKETR